MFDRTVSHKPNRKMQHTRLGKLRLGEFLAEMIRRRLEEAARSTLGQEYCPASPKVGKVP